MSDAARSALRPAPRPPLERTVTFRADAPTLEARAELERRQGAGVRGRRSAALREAVLEAASRPRALAESPDGS